MNSISSFRIVAKGSDLSPINTISAAGNPVYLRTDNSGKFLLSAYFVDSKAAIYSIRKDGGLLESAVQILITEKNAHAIQTDPTNRYLFISCRTGEVIHQFKFDPATGMLTPNAPAHVSTPERTGPRHLVFHKKLSVAYVANEFGSTVTAYRLHTLDGTLSAFQTLSTLPVNFTGTNTGADVHLTPDGRFLYASNRGYESIAGFSVDTTTGELTWIGQFATEKTPRSFAIDEDSKFLYVGGQGSGKIAAYRIDKLNGQLQLFSTYDAGKNPVWLLPLRITD